MPLLPVSDSLIVEQGFILPPTAEPLLRALNDGFVVLTAPARDPQLYLYDAQSQLIAQVGLIGGDVTAEMNISGFEMIETASGFMVAFQAQVDTVNFVAQMQRFVRFFDDDGAALGDPVALTGVHQFGTPIASTVGTRADGGSYVVYVGDDVFSPTNFYQAFDANGLAVGDPVALTTTSNNRYALETGGFAVADFAEGSNDAEIILYNDEGTLVSSATLTGTLAVYVSDVKVMPNGGLAVFLDDGDVHSVRFTDASGAPTSEEIQLVDYRSALQADIEIEFLPDGRFVMIGSVLDEDSSFAADNELLAYLFDASGNPIGDPIVVAEHANESEGFPEIIELADGRIAIGYFSIDQLGTTNSYRVRIFDAEGGGNSGGDGTISGTANGETIDGTDGGDIILGLAGDDILYGDPLRALDPDSFEAQIYRAYEAVFDRAPDAAGFAAFLKELQLGNLTQEQVIAEFVGSAEFAGTYGALTDQAFIEQLYRNVLGREGDDAGIAAFTAALTGGRSRASVVIEFANSSEFIQATTQGSAAFGSSVALDPAEGQVFRIYEAVFDRAPDAGGFTNFVNSIQGNVLDLIAIATEFVASAEFQATYGALSNADFVELLYSNVLPGNTDQAGRNAFTAALDGGSLSRAEVVAEFSESAEFRAQTDAAARAFRDGVFSDNADRLDGGEGNDILFGGRGADTFVFDVTSGDQDTVLDFQAGVDLIELASAGASFDSFAEVIAAGSQSGNNVVFDFGGGNQLTLNNILLNDLSESDFGFGSGPAAEKADMGAAVSEAPPTALEGLSDAEALMQVSVAQMDDGTYYLSDVWM